MIIQSQSFGNKKPSFKIKEGFNYSGWYYNLMIQLFFVFLKRDVLRNIILSGNYIIIAFFV
mgnify:CR=1 FL=1